MASKALVAISLLSLVILFASSALATPQYGAAIALYSGPTAPVGVAVNTSGSVYWANYDQGDLYSLAKGASVPTVLLSGLSHPTDVVVDSQGDVYFSQQNVGGSVSELPAGSSAPVDLFTANLAGFISVDSSGDVYFVPNSGCNGQGYTNSIMEYVQSSGQTITILGSIGSLGNNPSYGQVFVDSTGLYFTTCAGDVEILAAGASTPTVLVSGLQYGPSVSSDGVTADAQGDVFFTDYHNSVSILPAGSSSPIVLATAGSTHYGIALDSEGNVYYTDNLGGGIWEIPVAASSTTSTVSTVTITSTVTVASTTVSGPTTTITSGGPITTVTNTATATIIETRTLTNTLTSTRTTTVAVTSTSTTTSIVSAFQIGGSTISVLDAVLVVIAIIAVGVLSFFLGSRFGRVRTVAKS